MDNTSGHELMSSSGLLYTSKEHIKLKDFSSEVRALMDVEQFVHQSELILDMRERLMKNILDAMFEKVFSSEKSDSMRVRDARESVFLSGSASQMTHILQGVSPCAESEGSQLIKYDQSWVCAICNLVDVKLRHMVIARFVEPVDMGENAHEVRLFVLIVASNKDKDTKNGLETGRTFASMLIDADLRQNLLNAKSTPEFKAIMIVRAQQMAKVDSLQNRHIYSFEPAVFLSMWEQTNNLQNKTNGDRRLKKLDFRSEQQSSFYDKNPRASKIFELISQSSISNEVNQMDSNRCLTEASKSSFLDQLEFGKGLLDDIKRRASFYPSDFRDAFIGPPRTIQKTMATIWFLYFGILLPIIAFSSLNTVQTKGQMGDLKKALIGQAIGGLCFSLFGGQPLVIIMTTAPLCLYTKVIYQICNDYEFHFPSIYAAVGLWNGFFLVLYSLFGFSRLMKWCSRSTEEIFALFIVVAFITDASSNFLKNFHKYYQSYTCRNILNPTENMTLPAVVTSLDEVAVCRRETSILFLFLMLGTVWLGLKLFRLNKSPLFGAGQRAFLSDYALPLAVIMMSFLGSYVFRDVYEESLLSIREIQFERAKVELLSISSICLSMGFGFILSLLFFMDQNISAAMVNAPQNRLKKGEAYHMDLLVVGLLNGFLTLYGFPMMHGVLPHSPLHVRCLADIEIVTEEGHPQEKITNVRETRVTGIVSHILVLGTLLLVPYPVAYIPAAVLNGLFLYMAVTSLDGLQIFDRILLLFTEQSNYPPNHYVRRCPQNRIHKFTLLQITQLLILCLFGFSSNSIVEMLFPVIIMLFIPFRHAIVTKFIEDRYLEVLDGKHLH